MQAFYELTKRSVKIYLRDRGAVFFSLLSMFIVIMLMVLFLGDMNINAITGILENFPGRDADADRKNAEITVLLWTCAGILSINAVTITLSVFSGMIKDRGNGTLNAIRTSPVSRLTISGGYIAAAWLSSVIVCILTLAVSEIYCIMQGAEPFTVMEHLQLLGMIAANSFTYASIMFLFAAIARTEGAWSGMGTVIGTLVGFLGGIYLPVGSLNDGIAAVLKATPVLYGTVMFRQVMTKKILETTFSDVPSEVLEEYNAAMGNSLSIGGTEITIAMCTGILLGCGVVFLAAGTILQSAKKSG